MTEQSEQTKFDAVPSISKLPEVETKILEFWKQEHIFEKSQKNRNGSPVFAWLEGPPTANGLPHMGHALTRVYKDAMLRFQTMNGKQVLPRKAGWDCHGLPVEIEVEKELGFTKKQQILDYGIDKFNRKCRESVLRYEKEWRTLTERIGFWLDMDNPYLTMSDDYIESVWWSLKQLWEKGLLYKGVKVAPYCPRCGTTLSTHELALGYKEVKDPAITVKFKALDFPDDDPVYFLAWTTTPWTLISNVMLTVHPDYDYALVKHDGEKYILAKERIEVVFGKKIKPLKVFKGAELEGKRYEPLFPYLEKEVDKGYFVSLDTYVTLDEGTGIVHSAPAFGAEDAETGRRYGVTVLRPVKEDGTFDERITDFAGKFVKDADPFIIKKLEKERKLLKKETYEHSYPHCWRCKSPLLYYGIDSWFIGMSKLRDNLLKNNELIQWVPDHLKHGRFGKWLENVADWNLSRTRFWGTPLPVWTCDSCGHQEALGSKKELEEKAGSLPKDFELHRPWVDQITYGCPQCDGTMKREEFVIDCWYDSGSASFAQYHYPFENNEMFKGTFPYDFITEAIDQTRGWFYTLLAVSTALFDEPAYKSVLCLAHVLNEDGSKMSKSGKAEGNPWTVINKEGADPMRWFLLSTVAWNPTRYSPNLVNESMRRFVNTFWNVYSFFVNNANADKFDLDSFYIPLEKREELDRWLISRANRVLEEIISGFESLAFHQGAKAIDQFVVEELSNWWIRRSRRRFWSEELTDSKKSAYSTLYEVMVLLSKAIAPYTPFMAEHVYQNIVRKTTPTSSKESVHMEDFPHPDSSARDLALEEKMELVLQVAQAGRTARAQANIKLRQPLPKLVVVVSAENAKKLLPFKQVIAEELNVKELEITSESEEFVIYTVRPNFKRLAPRVKGLINKVKEALNDLSPQEARKLKEQIDKDEQYSLTIDSKEIILDPEDVEVLVGTIEGYEYASQDDVAVYLDTTITPDLKLEGFAREIVRRIQESRRQANLRFVQNIETWIDADPELIQSVEAHTNYISSETQSLSLKTGSPPDPSSFIKTEWDVEGKQLVIYIKPLD